MWETVGKKLKTIVVTALVNQALEFLRPFHSKLLIILVSSCERLSPVLVFKIRFLLTQNLY